MMVKPSMSTPSTPTSTSTSAPHNTAIRYKPMTIRVVTSDDEQSSDECHDDSGSETLLGSDDTFSFSENESLGENNNDDDDNDDGDFMPVIRAATAVPMRTQRAQARTTTSSPRLARGSPTGASFPPALVA